MTTVRAARNATLSVASAAAVAVLREAAQGELLRETQVVVAVVAAVMTMITIRRVAVGVEVAEDSLFVTKPAKLAKP